MPDELRLVGPFHVTSGYSKLARGVLRTATLAGYRVQAIESDYTARDSFWAHGEIKSRKIPTKFSKKYPIPELQRSEVERALKTKVSLAAPTLFIQFPGQIGGWHEYSSGPRIAWTMVESDSVTKDDWVTGLYGADLLITPSRYVWGTFRQYAPEQPLELLPLPVDDRIYNRMPGPCEIAGRMPAFLFLSVFNNRPRKQWQMTMQAFAEEFDDFEDVGLVVRPGVVGEVSEMAGWLRSEKRMAKRHIFVLDRWVSEEGLASWYRRANCYVLPSCEGFGLPFVEAAMCGTPSIALDDGGAADVVDESVGWRVKSRREVLYGNLPHVYDSSHKFAVPEDIHAVKWQMRNAFESTEHKGEAAYHRAMSLYTPQVLAEPLRQVIEKAERPYRGRTRMWRGVTTRPAWGICVGDGYGDALAVLGNCQEVLREHGGEQIGILHYGFNKGLEDFWRLQPCVREVVRVEPPDKETAKEVGNEVGAYYAYPKEKWIQKIAGETGIGANDIAETQVHWPWGTWPVHRPTDLVLPPAAEEWAEKKRAELGEFVLVQPYSTSSVGIQEHWPWWARFLGWLLKSTESTHLLVFCGLNEIPGLKGDNVVNLIGQTPTAEHMFALADRAKGCITTCNALPNWTACRGITPSLIAGNHAIPRADQFWPRFMSAPNNKLMLVDTSLPKFIAAAEKFLQGISK